MTAWRIARWPVLLLVAVCVLLTGAWASFALWFQLAGDGAMAGVLAGAMAVLTAAVLFSLATSRRWLVLTGYCAALAVLFAWWSTIKPVNDRVWEPESARLVTGVIEGDQLVVDNFRNFNWRSNTDFDQRWEDRTYSLAKVQSVDIILSYWAGEAIAHLMVSFGFADGQRLDFSIETRRAQGAAYSAIAGFFKQYELVIIAADERDMVRVRSNVRGEDVRIYRLRMPPAQAQTLLRQYIGSINDLSRTPRWYNTATANCTILAFDMAAMIHPGLPLDYRILLSGYLPDYAYDVGALDDSLPLARLRELSRIHDRAAQADQDPAFSARIRDGIPIPH